MSPQSHLFLVPQASPAKGISDFGDENVVVVLQGRPNDASLELFGAKSVFGR